MSLNRNNIILYCWLLASFCVANLLFMISDSDVVIVTFWIILCATLFVCKLKFVVKYIYYFYALTFNLLGIFMIENFTIYLSELRINSADYNALLPMMNIHFVFIFLLLLFDEALFSDSMSREPAVHIDIKNRDIVNIIIEAIGVVFFAMAFFLFINAVLHPAFVYAYDRFEYSQRFITGAWGIVNKYIVWLLPIIPLLLFNNKKVLGIASLVLYASYLFLIGHKFGEFFTIFVLLTPYVVYTLKLNSVDWKKILKGLLLISLALLVFVFVLFMYHRLTYGYSLEAFVVYCGQRFAQQGQMWWAVYGKDKFAPVHISEINDEIIGFWGLNNTSPHQMNYGIYKMMQYVTPYETYVAKILSGSSYTTTTCASIYYYSKYYGFVVILPIAALGLSYIVNWYWKSLYSNEIVGVIVAWVMVRRLEHIYLMSEFYLLFNLKYLLLLVIAIAIKRYLATKRKNSAVIRKRIPV